MPSCSSVLARPSPCRTLWSVQDPLPGSPQLLLAQTLDLCQKLLQIVHHLFSCQTRAPQTIQASQAASHSQEAMEFHLHGFHSDIRHNHVATTCTTICPACLLKAQCPEPCHLGSWVRIRLPFLPVTRNRIGHEVAFHLGLSP